MQRAGLAPVELKLRPASRAPWSFLISVFCCPRRDGVGPGQSHNGTCCQALAPVFASSVRGVDGNGPPYRSRGSFVLMVAGGWRGSARTNRGGGRTEEGYMKGPNEKSDAKGESWSIAGASPDGRFKNTHAKKRKNQGPVRPRTLDRQVVWGGQQQRGARMGAWVETEGAWRDWMNAGFESEPART